MDRNLEEQVWLRARSRCEYCHFPADFAEYAFHVDHIIAQKHGGKTEADNLALSCFYCNTFKGPNIAGLDPTTGALTPFFIPAARLGESTSAGKARSSRGSMPLVV